MKKKNGTYPKIIASFAVLLAVTVIFAVITFLSSDTERVAVIITYDFTVLFLFLFGMIADFLRSIKRTLYRYANVCYVGGILFVFTLLVYSVIAAVRGELMSAGSVLRVLSEFPHRFSILAVPVMAIVCILICISNLSLIKHEGFRPKNLLGIVLAVIYIGGTAAIFGVSELLAKTVFSSPSEFFAILNTYISLFLVLLMCYFECMLAGCTVMGYLAVKKVPAYDKDYIIILGCSIDKKGGLLPLLKARTNRAIRFAWEQEIATGKALKYVPSGGKGENEIMSEGSAMEFYLLSHGAEDYEVLPEKESRDTYENMLFSKRLIDKEKPDASIAFATTNFHVFRSGIIARRAGIEAEGVASRTKWYFWPNGFIREFFAIMSITKTAHIAAAVIIAAVCVALAVISAFAGVVW